MVLMMII